MSDDQTPEPTSDTDQTIRVKAVKQLRLIRTAERPDDAVLEITCSDGPHHYLLPASGLNDLGTKLAAFPDHIASDGATGSNNGEG